MASVEYNNLPFPPEDLTDAERNFVLGRFMTAWSQVEGVCAVIFLTLTDIPPETSRIIFDRIGTREQIEIVRALYETVVDEAERTRGAELLAAVETLSTSRNKIVHAGWGLFNREPARFWHGITSANIDEIVRETPKGATLRNRYIFTVGDITALADNAKTLSDDLQDLLHLAMRRRVDAQLAQFGRRLRDQPRPIPPKRQ